MARSPDEGRARDFTVNTRVTAKMKKDIDRSRGAVGLSVWARQAFLEKIAREK